VSGWKRAQTKTSFVFSAIAFEFHNSLTFTQISDIMSCLWNFVFCMQLSRQKGMGSNPANCTKHFFTKSIFNFVIVTELVYLQSRSGFKQKMKITFKIYNMEHTQGFEPQFSDLKSDTLPTHYMYFLLNS
jgi:hypothetical protein